MAFKIFSHHRTFRWMRQLHLWIGAWGAIAALLFGITGLVLNHRIGDNAWPQGKTEPVRKEQIVAPAEVRTSPEAMSTWLRQTRGLDADMIRKPRPGGGEGGRPDGPQKWNFSGGSARNSWSAEYVVGGENVDVKWSTSSPLAVFNKLHKGIGGTWWRVLSDSYAIAMILLALTGLWMWARGRGVKEMVMSVFALAALATGSAFVLAFL
ncbi:PepSY-associated TM helix domain-containing protein [Solilutibacter silvestris]|uniref:PepSY-associated TM helix domain-containing protein n=1 Tax=Solilutibacter silvestris TaxID=1645665 RepID=UPI003D350458